MIHTSARFPWLLGSCLWFSESIALGRWVHTQADRPAQFEKLGTEYYNDILSYRMPRTWMLRQQSSNVVAAASAGSLNQKEFFYEEHLKLYTEPDTEWQLGVEAKRSENPTNSISENQFELSYGPEQGAWRLGLLADPHGEKAYNDLGISARIIAWNDFQIAAFLWAVDPFFEDKKLNPDDKRLKDTWSQQLTLSKAFGDWQGELSWMEDSPVVWVRTERQETYRYSRTQWKPRITYKMAEHEFYFEAKSEQQKEGIDREDGIRAYTHRSREAELGFITHRGLQVYLWGHQDKTRYQGASDSYPARIPGLQSIHREEGALVATQELPLWDSTKHEQHIGFMLNQVDLREEKTRRNTELKLQWAFDFEISPQGRLLLGTTWDVDQLLDDLQQRSGKPAWGGGYGQILLAF